VMGIEGMVVLRRGEQRGQTVWGAQNSGFSKDYRDSPVRQCHQGGFKNAVVESSLIPAIALSLQSGKPIPERLRQKALLMNRM